MTTREEIKFMELQTKYARLLGLFEGTLEGIICWNIPVELKTKLTEQLKRLKDEKLD